MKPVAPTLNRCLVLCCFLLVAGCQETDAYAMCSAAGYPKVIRVLDHGKVRFYCHRIINATDEMKEIHP